MSWRDAPVDPSYSKEVPVPPTGIPQEDPSSVGQDVRDMARSAYNFSKPAALPTIGSMLLPAAATALAGPANLPFVPIEQGVGSGVGEGLNQLFGITEPSLTQVGASTLLPIAAGYGANLLRTGKALAPTLNTEAPIMATKQMQGYRDQIPARTLFDNATREGVKVPLPNTFKAFTELRTAMEDATPAGKKAFENVLKDTGLTEAITAKGRTWRWDGVSPAKLQSLLADVGKLQGQASREGGLKASYLGTFFSSLSQDLEQSGAALGPARQAFKRESVLNEIDDAISNAMFVKKGQGQQTEFSANKILNTLNKKDVGLGKYFAQSFSPKEQAEIKGLFGFLNTLPSLKPGAGVTYGSGQFMDTLARAGSGGGVGGGIGYAVGGVPGAVAGAAAGLAAPALANFGKLMMSAWKMPGGQQVVKKLLTNSDGAVTPYVVSSLTSFLTGIRADRPMPIQASGGMTLQPFPNQR